MTLLDALILGLVEGITEYLPISSTGHLIIAAALLGLDDPAQKEAIDTFTIAIQGGAILAVLGLYWSRVKRMLAGLVGRDPAGLRLAVNLIVAFIPAAIFGVLLNDWIERELFKPGPVLLALALGGVWMIGIDLWRKSRPSPELEAVQPEATPPPRREIGIDDLTPGRALAIGLFQVLAMWPGTSRSMMTIAGGVVLGLKPKDAAEFSFLLGLPTLGGACAYRLYKNFSGTAASGDGSFIDVLGWPAILVGFVVATVSAALAVKWLVAFLNRHGLTAFGVYRLILSGVLGALLAAGLVAF